MAVFLNEYPTTRKVEGYYSNRVGDKGGETYAGIARVLNPTWVGWPILDNFKKTLGRAVKWNEKIPILEPYVQPFYLAWWNRLNLSAIKDQKVAGIIWDFIVNSGTTGTLEVETVLQNIFKSGVKADRTFDAATITMINAQDPTKLYNAIRAARVALYNRLANTPQKYTVQASDTVAKLASTYKLPISEVPSPLPAAGNTIMLKTQRQFLEGWLDRIDNDFPALKVAAGVGGILLLAGAVVFFLAKRKKNNGRVKKSA